MSIKRKIEAVGTPLKDWNIQINYGIKTGCNDAFIIDEAKRNEILGKCADEEERTRTAELIRPILRGRDIKRYGYDWAGKYLINTHNGVKGKIPRIKIEDYPAIKAHLDQYWNDIAKRADKGDTPYNLRNCAYMEDFAQPKIVYQELCRTGCAFAVDHNGYMVSNTAYLLTVNDSSEINIEYLAKFLNSPIALYQLDRICSKFDETGWRWLHQFIEKIYISKLAISDWKTGFQLDDEEYKFICSKYKSVLPELNDTILKLVD